MINDRNHGGRMRICLNDSIFKDKGEGGDEREKKREMYGEDKRQSGDIHHKMMSNNEQQRVLLQYLNGSYYGQTNHIKTPQGLGIIIDDQFNLFLSHFKPPNTLTSLTLIILLNGIKLYGSWIDGKPNGWNCIQIGKVKIFAEFKNSYEGRWNILSPMIVVDDRRKIAYLVQVEVSEMLYTKIQIRGRRRVHQLMSKSENKMFIDPKDIFQQLVKLNIPHFLLTFEDFLIHLKQNIPAVEIKKINKNSELLTCISLKDAEKVKNKDSLSCFVPFPDLVQQNQKINQRNNKKLGILLSQKDDRIKTIGQFSQGYQLSGRGITFPSNSTGPLFGIFKSDMLVKQFSHPEPFSTKLLYSRQLKKQLTHYHMRSTNFVHNFVYFNEVDSVLQLMNKVIDFVNVFQDQYSKRHGNEIDSYSQSENQYEEGKYYQQGRNDIGKSEYQDDIKENTFHHSNTAFVKPPITRQHILTSTQKSRPFGRIVNSRSPLRQIPDHSRSKSPSQIQTKRDRSISPSPHIINDKRSLKKDLFISIKSFTSNNYASNKYNVETTRNRSKQCSAKKAAYDKDNNKQRYFLAHNHNQHQVYRQEDVLETIRVKDVSRGKYGQSDIGDHYRVRSGLYSRHLRNNYVKKR